MKRTLIFAAPAAMLITACDEPVSPEPENVSGLVKLNLSLSAGETKSVGTDDENKVDNVQVYIFDDDGSIEAYRFVRYMNQTVLSSASTSLECTPGPKKIVAIVNAPEMPDVKSYDDMKSRTSRLADNGKRSLHMVGEVSENIEAEANVTIPVSRIAAKIRIASITNKMSVEYYRGQGFSVNDIYMLNVVGNTGYLEDQEPDVWFNRMKKEDTGGLIFMLQRNNSTAISVPYPQTVTLTQDQEHAYYVYPNSTETDTSDPEWSPRYTRLVLEARIGQDRYYYPVSIPDVERNTAYEVHLTVTRPGSSSPDVPVDVEAVSVTVNVVDWTDADDINETI
jgi:hypothetical protein